MLAGFGLGLASCTGTVGTGGDDGYPGTPGSTDGSADSRSADSGSTSTGSGTGGSGTGTTGSGGGSINPDPSEPPMPGAVDQPLRRLSHFEYENTLSDLFPELTLTLPDLAADETIDGFSNHWDAMQPSDLLIEQYFSTALSIARQLGTAEIADLTNCDEVSCAGDFVGGFGERVFRRPLTDAERETYLGVFETGPGANDFVLGVQLTVLSMLQSPHFLYRPEFGVGEVVDVRGRRLSGFETASRLSYLLWSSMPDDALLAVARGGELSNPEVIEREARRLLADPRSQRGVSQFFREWLKLARLERIQKLPDAGWDEGFRNELIESAMRFTYEQVFVSGGSSVDLLTSGDYPVTAAIATLLGENSDASGWTTISANPEQRSGILTHPAFLGAHGYGEYGSPVLRGVYVMDRILCAPPSPPPGDTDIVLPEPPGAANAPRTNREAYEQATMGPGCPVCHLSINAFGFAFENYDTLGRYREQDSGFAVNASGSVSDFDFSDAVDLSHQLAEDRAYQSCVVDKWTKFALGGSPLAKDPKLLFDLMQQFEARQFALDELLIAIAVHERFSGWLATAEPAP